MPRHVALSTFRRIIRYTSLASVACVTLAIYSAIQGRPIVAIALGLVGVAVGLYPSRIRIRPAESVTLVTKRDCSLCSEAKQALLPRLGRRNIALEEAFIEQDPSLAEQYRDWVPVLLVRGQAVGKGRFDWVAVDRALDAMVRTNEPF